MQDVGSALFMGMTKPSVRAAMRPSMVSSGAKLLEKQLQEFRLKSLRRRWTEWHVTAVELTLVLVDHASALLRRTARRWLANVELQERVTLQALQVEGEVRAVTRFVAVREIFVIHVQSLARGRNAREFVQHRVRLISASCVAQRGARCNAAKVTLTLLRFEHLIVVSAAVLVQSRVRGRYGRARFCAVQVAERVSKITRCIEQRALARRARFQINGAAITIQGHWHERMRKRRHFFMEERIRVRKADIIRRSILNFNARARRRHRQVAGKDVYRAVPSRCYLFEVQNV